MNVAVRPHGIARLSLYLAYTEQQYNKGKKLAGIFATLD